MECNMRVVIILLFVAFGKSLADVNKIFETPRKTTVDLMERNEKSLKELSTEINSEKMKTAYTSFLSETLAFIKKQEERYNKIESEIQKIQESAMNKTEGINLDDCSQMWKDNSAKNIPSFYSNMVLSCLRLYTNEPKIIYTQEYLQANITTLLDENSKAKHRLQECLSDKSNQFKAIECLMMLRQITQETYTFKIIPLKKEIDEMPNHLKNTMPNIPKCTEKNPLMDAFWQEVKDFETKYKNCITEKIGKIE